MSQSKRTTELLLDWYDTNKRALPWRETRDPYLIWVSEVMLQQTRVETVIPYYQRFTTRYPTVEALAGASLDDVLKMWENLGYYSRARRFHQAAQIIVAEHGGRIPQQYEAFISLPGVGKYIAGAVLSNGFGAPLPAVDGNVLRVFSRLQANHDPVDNVRVQNTVREWALSLIPEDRPGDFNQSLMELGALICTPKSPQCTGCPVHRVCRAHEMGIQDELPVRKKKKPLPHHDMTAAVIIDHDNRYLLVQRPAEGLLGGLWKWPGGRKQPGEDLPACLKRSVFEEAGLNIIVKSQLFRIRHQYTHFRITLHVFKALLQDQENSSLDTATYQWTPRDLILDLALSKADREVWRMYNESPEVAISNS